MFGCKKSFDFLLPQTILFWRYLILKPRSSGDTIKPKLFCVVYAGTVATRSVTVIGQDYSTVTQ